MPDRRLQAIRCSPTPDSARSFAVKLQSALIGGDALLPLPSGPSSALTDALDPDLGVPERTAVVIGTSGSTGEPKGVALSAAALISSATATHRRLGGPGHWLLTLPFHHIAGVQVLVRTLTAGTELAVLDTSGGFTAARFAAAARTMPPGRRYTALVPTQLRRLLDDPAALESFDAVLIGGAAADPALLARAGRHTRILTTYGMSETAGGCVYDRVALDGAAVAIDDPPGPIRLAGPMLADGYLRRPELTAESFADGWFHTRDLGRWGPDGTLEVLGRADDVVVSGGEKIAPLPVERALLAVPGVREACVVGLSDPEWGQIVAAAVVGEADPDRLRAAVRETLGPVAAPKRIVVVAELPMLASGKVDRRAVAAELRYE